MGLRRAWWTRLMLARHARALWHPKAVHAARRGATLTQIHAVMAATADDNVRVHAFGLLPGVLTTRPVNLTAPADALAVFIASLRLGLHPYDAHLVVAAGLTSATVARRIRDDGRGFPSARVLQQWAALQDLCQGDPVLLDAWLTVPGAPFIDLDEAARLTAVVGSRAAPRFAAAGVTWAEADQNPEAFTDDVLATLVALRAGLPSA